MTNAEITKIWLNHSTPETIERMRQFMHPNHKFYTPLVPMSLGIEEHIGMLHKMNGAFSNQIHHIDILLESEGYITVRGRLSATHTGEFQEIEATNNPFEVTFMVILEFVEGKIRNEYIEMNQMSILAQIEAIKKP